MTPDKMAIVTACQEEDTVEERRGSPPSSGLDAPWATDQQTLGESLAVWCLWLLVNGE